MKTIQKLAFVCLVLFMASCTDDNSLDPNADARDKFLGEWKCKETIGTDVIAFTLAVTKSGEGDTILMNNFSALGSTATAIGLVTGNSLVIPAQEIGVTNIPVQGSGVYSDNGGEKITLNYTVAGETASTIGRRN